MLRVLALFSRCIVLLILLFESFSAIAEEQLQFANEPQWIEKQTVQPSNQTPVGGLKYLLIDRQINLEEKQISRYQHFAVAISNTVGLEQASQLSFEFDPAYETLIIHRIDVIRNGQILSRLEPNEFHLFQREPNLEHYLYSGVQTAHVILPDIRVGDVLEYSYTVVGNNPVLNNKFSEDIALDAEIPIAMSNVRILVYSGRTLYYAIPDGKSGKFTLTDTSTHREISWQEKNIPAIQNEDDIPSWFSAHRYWAITEFSSWQDVIHWAKPMYDEAVVVDPTIQTAADELAKDKTDDQTKLVAALHFVQQEIRYLGIEDGISSHLPRKAPDTLYRRYGDCKDKTVLLMALLKAMNIDVTPALVNLDRGSVLPKLLPSPLVFNHVILSLNLNGQQYWLDSTDLNQGNDLNTMGVPFYFNALLLSDNTTTFTSMLPQARDAEIKTSRELWLNDGRGHLFVSNTYAGNEAENQRTILRSISQKELNRQFQTYYSHFYPELESNNNIEIVDNREQNQFQLRKSFELPEIPDDMSRHGLPLYPDLIDGYLKNIDAARTQPVQLGIPTKTRQEFVFHLPYDVNIADYNQHYDNAVFSFSINVQQTSNRSLKVIYRYYNHLDYVPVKELAKYREAVAQVRDELALNFTFPPPAPANQSSLTSMTEAVPAAATDLVPTTENH